MPLPLILPANCSGFKVGSGGLYPLGAVAQPRHVWSAILFDYRRYFVLPENREFQISEFFNRISPSWTLAAPHRMANGRKADLRCASFQCLRSGHCGPSFSVVGLERRHLYYRPHHTTLFAVQRKKPPFARAAAKSSVGTTAVRDKPDFRL